MIILSTLASANVRVKRGKHAGREVMNAYGIAVEAYGLALVKKSGENPWVVRKSSPYFRYLTKHLEKLGIDVSNAEKLVTQSLFHAYGKPQPTKHLTMNDLDAMFTPFQSKRTKRGNDSSGMMQIFVDVRKHVKGQTDEEEETESESDDKEEKMVVVPDFDGKAYPQASFNEVEETE